MSTYLTLLCLVELPDWLAAQVPCVTHIGYWSSPYIQEADNCFVNNNLHLCCPLDPTHPLQFCQILVQFSSQITRVHFEVEWDRGQCSSEVIPMNQQPE